MTCIVSDVCVIGLEKAIFPLDSAGKLRWAGARCGRLSTFETLLG